MISKEQEERALMAKNREKATEERSPIVTYGASTEYGSTRASYGTGLWTRDPASGSSSTG